LEENGWQSEKRKSGIFYSSKNSKAVFLKNFKIFPQNYYDKNLFLEKPKWDSLRFTFWFF